MATQVCLVAILIGAAAGQAAQVQPSTGQDILLSTSQALAGVDRLDIVFATSEVGQEGLIETSKLRARIAEKLSETGIKPAEGETDFMPRLVVRIESAPLPERDRCACWVQVSLTRVVILPDRPDVRIRAEVWQSKPAMEVIVKPDVAGTISTAVLTQTDAFVTAWKAAGTISPLPQSIPAPPVIGQGQPSPRNLPAASGYLFVSSTSSQVFHRPDCRWAQNIAGGKLVGYKSRPEAVQAGKRPCKTCKP